MYSMVNELQPTVEQSRTRYLLCYTMYVISWYLCWIICSIQKGYMSVKCKPRDLKACTLLVGLGSDKVCVKRWLDGMAETTECRTSERVTVTCLTVLLGHCAVLPSPRQVHMLHYAVQCRLTLYLSPYVTTLLFRDLFNVAFVSCWSELHEELQNELVKHLEMALESQIPEITQTLLNLAEFMEHTEKVKHQNQVTFRLL